MRQSLPGKVPLPLVGDYTEEIVFGELGFPANLDIERLSIHLRALETARQAGGLGRLSIQGMYTDESGLSFNSLGSDGTATALSSISIETDPSAHGAANFIHMPFFATRYIGPLINDQVSTTIKVNLSKRDRLVREKEASVPHVAENPDFHAKFLNRALKRGLISSSIAANTDPTRAATTLAAYGGLLASRYAISGGKINSWDILSLLGARTAYLNLGLAAAYIASKRTMKSIENPKARPSVRDMLREGRQSLLFGTSLDRLIMGVSTGATMRFVSTKK